MAKPTSFQLTRPLQWSDVYSEAEIYKAALRVYTKPLFHWRKALSTSVDGRTLYDFAGRGLRSLDSLHQALQRKTFSFRPAVALHYNFNGKHRTIYLAPWEERIVDLLLYRVLNHKLQEWFSPDSYAYREGSFGLDLCQTRIAAVLRAKLPLYVIKRDIADYFATVNHDVLLSKLSALVSPDDYLFRLLEQRVRFLYQENGLTQQATLGIPFGTAIACLFANIYLTELDREIQGVADVSYFRYADDILLMARQRNSAMQATTVLEQQLSALRLKLKTSREANLLLAGGDAEQQSRNQKSKPKSTTEARRHGENLEKRNQKQTTHSLRSVQAPDTEEYRGSQIKSNHRRRDLIAGDENSSRCPRNLTVGSTEDSVFSPAAEFRHLGLLFRAGGSIALSRDKLRKVQNLFSFAFRRARRRWKKVGDPLGRAHLLVTIAAETIEHGLRNVAIIDYYLKHVDDEDQLRILDRWLAEEILSLVFGGHKKNHFRRISFEQLRKMGLPSLVHRRRLILRGKIESPFFIWQRQKATRTLRGTVARLPHSKAQQLSLLVPEAAANKRP